MDLDEMQQRLTAFLRDRLDDAQAQVTSIEPGPGHAGFSYLFEALTASERRGYFIRLPPPNVKWEGTADVLRQVCSLNALAGTAVPHAPVIWSGDDLEWFGCPYFIQSRLGGDVLRDEYLLSFTDAQRREMGRQAMTALAGIHRVDWQQNARALGEFWGYEFDITRWDRFAARAAEPQQLALQPAVRQNLLDKIPGDAHIGLCHGDFQWANLMYSTDARLLAVIDWELTGIGPTLNDLGWLAVFNDARAWAHAGSTAGTAMPEAAELEAMYRDAWGADAGDLRWFKALAVYKFSIISGFNLMLHRRGKRHDPHWEEMIPSIKSNMEYAAMMLSD